MEKFSLEEFLALAEGATRSYEPWDKDDDNNPLAPGSRCRVTIAQSGYPKTIFFADRDFAQSIVDFLDKIKEES